MFRSSLTITRELYLCLTKVVFLFKQSGKLRRYIYIYIYIYIYMGTAVAQWLRCCATNRKVAGSIPPGVR